MAAATAAEAVAAAAASAATLLRLVLLLVLLMRGKPGRPDDAAPSPVLLPPSSGPPASEEGARLLMPLEAALEGRGKGGAGARSSASECAKKHTGRKQRSPRTHILVRYLKHRWEGAGGCEVGSVMMPSWQGRGVAWWFIKVGKSMMSTMVLWNTQRCRIHCQWK